MKPAKKGTQRTGREAIKILFIAGFGPIVRDVAASGQLYGETLGIPFKKEGGGYLHTETLKGTKSFALWPLPQAAQSCFGKDSWPGDVPVPTPGSNSTLMMSSRRRRNSNLADIACS